MESGPGGTPVAVTGGVRKLLLLAAVVSGCSTTIEGTGEPADQDTSADLRVQLLDVDGDGAWDAVDLDADGAADMGFDAACGRYLLGGSDGVWDGLDFDCSGSIDAPACVRP